MTPVQQDMFFEPGVDADNQRGNCVSACVASMLDLPLRAVPNFVEIDVLGGPNWFDLLVSYLWYAGWELRWVDVRNPPMGVEYAVGGVSERSTEEIEIQHLVVYRDGKLLWDPHPKHTGIMTEEDAWVLVKRS